MQTVSPTVRASSLTTESPDRMPHGVWQAYMFQVFNCWSFSIVVGTPMVLYFKHHGASATMLGVVLAMSPLLNILQLPASRYVEHAGYRAFVLRGWTTRSFFILGMAIVALLPSSIVSTGWRLGSTLVLLAAFNAARGFYSCGYLPWMTAWIPETVRGRFLSRDQTATALGGTLIMVATALFMRGGGSNGKFGLLFLVSFVAAMTSLLFLRRIPDVPVTDKQSGRGQVPWLELLRHPPFLRFMIFNAVMYTGLGGAGVLWVPLLRDVYKCGEGWILGMSAVTTATIAAMALCAGPLADRVGSRPLLGAAGLVFVVHFVGWLAVAAHWWTMDLSSALYICVTAGIGFGLFNLANMRLAMAIVPAMGRSHFFALFSVINNLVLGLMPVAWGFGVDRLTPWQSHWGEWQWNGFTLLYAIITTFIIAAIFVLRSVSEARTMTTDQFLFELMVKTPARALSRLLMRRPPQ
jgi:MFS family permease